jgi:hypothetical protein
MRLPEIGGPVSRIYIPQEQSGPIIFPGTELSFTLLYVDDVHTSQGTPIGLRGLFQG